MTLTLPLPLEYASFDDGTLGMGAPMELLGRAIMKEHAPDVPQSRFLYSPPRDQEHPWFDLLRDEPIEPAWRWAHVPVLFHPTGLRAQVLIRDLSPWHPQPETTEHYFIDPEYWDLTPRHTLAVARGTLFHMPDQGLASRCTIPNCRCFAWEGRTLCGWHMLKRHEPPSWPDLIYQYVPSEIETPTQQALFGLRCTPPFNFLQEVRFVRYGYSAQVRLEDIQCYIFP